MADLRSILSDASDASIISPETAERLLPFLTARGVVAAVPTPPVARSTWFKAAEDLSPVGSDIEMPRFIRGFHDVLITIGVIVALSGLWGLASMIAVVPAIIVLSEILVKRQRLALPAVVLTLAVVIWMGTFTSLSLMQRTDFLRGDGGLIRLSALFPPVLAIYYVRYRVPLALALCISSILVFVMAVLLWAIQQLTGDPLFVTSHISIVSALCLVAAIVLFLTALRFDLSDRERRTTRSDTAFWLHLAAAPSLLYSTLSLFALQGNWFDLTKAISGMTVVVVVTVAAMMLIGLIIDRRAFVTSGLLSLGYALYPVFKFSNAGVDTYVFATLLAVGIIVLAIGTGWIPLRRMVIDGLPDHIARRLPPA